MGDTLSQAIIRSSASSLQNAGGRGSQGRLPPLPRRDQVHPSILKGPWPGLGAVWMTAQPKVFLSSLQPPGGAHYLLAPRIVSTGATDTGLKRSWNFVLWIVRKAFRLFFFKPKEY